MFCSEEMWPYNLSEFTTPPFPECFPEALKNKIITGIPIPNDLLQIKAWLALGFRIVFGISVFESFESSQVEQTGIVPMPEPGEACVGGHCTTIEGYVEADQRTHNANSWGARLGRQRFFHFALSVCESIRKRFVGH